MSNHLPTGTVTFLFTDVEGSTKLLHELGAEAYDEALIEHRRALRGAFRRHGGVEVDTQGDAFFYAFPTAEGALQAADEGQAALAEGPITVRMGLHTGTPHIGREGYIGDDVHLGARIAASAHGGQIVCSMATAEIVELELTDLGEHRLKDISEAVPIYQLGNGSFPPLKTISNTNLPRPASSFVGRDDEVLEVLSRFEDGARLVTLTGPGGTGKTRLAIEAASELVSDFKAGVFWVGLTALRDPALVTETIAQTLGAKDGLAEHVGEREMLVLLDNLEQVIDSAPELAALLEACPNLRLLVTSRELLRIRGEVEYAVPPLAEPEAVSLFCERSQLAADEAIAELCRRLDNLPLAVELAAARTSVLTPDQIVERLSQRLDLLKGGRDVEDRQQTLRATIEWSYELLAPEEQQLFARLSVFAGGCTVEAAEEVCDADLDTLQSLVEKSLLRFTDGRYWMLETIREYAAETLEAAREDRAVRERYAHFVLRFAGDLEAAGGTDVALASFAAEQDNVRAVLGWAEAIGRADVQQELVGRIWPFYWYRGNAREGERWVASALPYAEAPGSAGRAKVLAAGAMFSYRRGNLEAMKRYAEESLQAAQTAGDEALSTWPLILLGLRAAADADYAEADRLYREAHAIARRSGDRSLAGIVLNNLGNMSALRGDFVGAVALFEQALAISRELGTSDEMAIYGYNLGFALHQIGRIDDAAEYAAQSLVLAYEIGAHSSLAYALVLLSAVAIRRGNADTGAQLLGAAGALWSHMGEQPEALEARFMEATSEDAERALGTGEFSQALIEGRAMSLEDAVARAVSA